MYLNENERKYNRKKVNNPPSKTSDFNLNNNRKSGNRLIDWDAFVDMFTTCCCCCCCHSDLKLEEKQ